MATNRLGFALVGFACVVAAGGGSYLATRQNLGQVAVPAAVASTPAVVTEAIAPAPAPAVPAVESLAAEPAARPAAPPVAAEPPSAVRPTRTQPVASRPPKAPARRPAPQLTAEATAPAATASAVQSPVSAEPATSPDEPPAIPPADTRPVVTAPPESHPARTEQEVVVAADSVIGLQTEGLITSEKARVEDRVEARVVRDVRVSGVVAIPAGTRALGTVVVVERGGKVRERARLGIKFDTLVLADGTRLAIATEPIYRWGESPSNGSAARIGGGAVAGAILGAIIAGGKGAAIGATTGAGAGTATVLGGQRSAAAFPPGSEVTARILAPVAVSVERHEQ